MNATNQQEERAWIGDHRAVFTRVPLTDSLIDPPRSFTGAYNSQRA
jgi:hypothetical protein